MSETKKPKVKRYQWTDLSPHTIISEILVHYEYFFTRFPDFCNDSLYPPPYQKNFCDVRKDFNATLLFGYFKLDQLRNIWFIFRSIHIEKYAELSLDQLIRIDSKKVVSLTCSRNKILKYIQVDEFPNLVRLVFNKDFLVPKPPGTIITKFPRMEHLELNCNLDIGVGVYDNTLRWFNLKQLKTLKLKDYSLLCVRNINFINLRSLELVNWCHKPTLSKDFFVDNSFPKLKYLLLYGINNLKDIRWTDKMDQIEHIVLSNCENVPEKIRGKKNVISLFGRYFNGNY